MHQAQELGLELLGITKIHEVDTPYFSSWLSSGKHADMQWISRSQEKRMDPRVVLKGAKSMILVTLNYFQGNPPDEIAHDPSRGMIARYAWYPEYHDVLKKKLDAIVAYLQKEIQEKFSFRSYVDTGPILERHWAKQAKLGFIGNNSNLIFWKYGSYVFLGEILLDIDLPEIQGGSIGGCGHCRACLDACPTQAIVRPKVVDARSCISYLTIEHRGSIPERLRLSMGNRIFGCDICQEVCPWNSKAKKIQGLPEPDWNVWAPKLANAVLFSQPKFEQIYANSPVLRTKYRGFIRNVCVALGNWGTPEAHAALSEAKQKHAEDPLLMEHIDWAQAQCSHKE